MNKVKEWLSLNNIDTNVNFRFKLSEEYDDVEDVVLTFNKALAAAKEKVGSEEQLIKAFEKIKNPVGYYTDNLQAAIQNELENYIHAMAQHKAYEDITDFDWKEIEKETQYTKEFLQWWQKEKGLTERQMLCDHDERDTWSINGQFYNSVGVCKKCNCDEKDDWNANEDIELVYKAWNRT